MIILIADVKGKLKVEYLKEYSLDQKISSQYIATQINYI